MGVDINNGTPSVGHLKTVSIGRQLHLVVKVIVKLIHILFGGFKVDYEPVSLGMKVGSANQVAFTAIATVSKRLFSNP